MILTHRPLGQTGIQISPITLGTVKWGRNQNLKFPHFELPDDATLHALLDIATDSGINHLDTAPAYGIAEERIGKLLANRNDRDQFHITTKAGEIFTNGQSTFNFTKQGILASIESSLKKLRRDSLDLVMIHSSPDDVDIIDNTPALETLTNLKSQGKIRAIGFSTMTVPGGLKAVPLCDALMIPYNLSYQSHRPVLDAAAEAKKGIIIKRGLFSGGTYTSADLPKLIQAVFDVPGITSLAVGTINPAHLKQNAQATSAIT
jgi:aryl-alcohol dehydrogenase-like predicted oxidoreductase